MAIRAVVAILMGISLILFSSSVLAYAFTETENIEEIKIDQSLTRPTFGISHQNNEVIVDNGFKFNNQTFSINNNFHTPFSEQFVHVGVINSFEATIYAEKGLKVQEFLFGIPLVGEAHLAELGVEIWFGYDGEIQEIKVIQQSNVIDEDSIIANHEKIKCLDSDFEEKCDLTKISMTFLEPLKDKVMALKAIDYKNRYQITYLNEGFEVTGASLNQMRTELIPSEIKGEGLIEVTQIGKYSHYWIAKDGRMFEKNDFGSFSQVNKSFERFQDSGEPRTRLHSGFGGILDNERIKAVQIFDADQLISKLPESIASIPPEFTQRISEEMKEKMLLQEEKAKKIFEQKYRQAKY